MTDRAASESVASAREDGPRKHHWTVTKRGAPRLGIRSTAINQAALVALPWSRPAYPGFYGGLVEIFATRAPIETVRAWLSGHRRTPQWANQMMQDYLRQRRNAIDLALAELEKEKPRTKAGAESGEPVMWRPKGLRSQGRV